MRRSSEREREITKKDEECELKHAVCHLIHRI